MSYKVIKLEGLDTNFGENPKDSLMFLKEVTLVGGEADITLPVFPDCQVLYALFKKATTEADGTDTILTVNDDTIGATDTVTAVIIVRASNSTESQPYVQSELSEQRTVI